MQYYAALQVVVRRIYSVLHTHSAICRYSTPTLFITTIQYSAHSSPQINPSPQTFRRSFHLGTDSLLSPPSTSSTSLLSPLNLLPVVPVNLSVPKSPTFSSAWAAGAAPFSTPIRGLGLMSTFLSPIRDWPHLRVVLWYIRPGDPCKRVGLLVLSEGR